MFRWLASKGGLGEAELLKTFNAGIGWFLIVAPERATEIAALLRGMGETVIPLGEVGTGAGGVVYSGALL